MPDRQHQEKFAKPYSTGIEKITGQGPPAILVWGCLPGVISVPSEAVFKHTKGPVSNLGH
jgi:hypothetical protein